MDRNRIYGIEFDEAVPSGGEKRILDACGLVNDYVVGDRFQNGGKNDFDQAYPFGAIRLCCVTLEGGSRRVVYEGEPGFRRTGEAGNVMAEIPLFYSSREKHGTVERWMVSGVCHPGFAPEPVFVRDGRILERVYVGVYNTTQRGKDLFSAAGDFPDVCKTPLEFSRAYAAAGYMPYDLAMRLCLERLMVIEFGTRYLKKHLGSVGSMRYFYQMNPRVEIKAMAPNRVTIFQKSWGKCFAPGHEIGFGHQEHDRSIHATILQVEENSQDPEMMDIIYGGPDLRGRIAPGTDAAFGIPQKNGLSDALSYHTGRLDMRCLDMAWAYLVGPFRWRGIENVWGNVWEYTEGIRVRGLRYYVTFEPALYEADLSFWQELCFSAPLQDRLADGAKGLWIDAMGFDPALPLVLLPAHAVGNWQTHGEYYDSAVYTYGGRTFDNLPIPVDEPWRCVSGGGFDHSLFGSLFTLRAWIDEDTAEWINSSRVCLR